MGDGGGRLFGGDRDKTLSARRILVNRYRGRRDHQAVHAFNERTPRSSVGNYAYKDFLWRDVTVPPGDLNGFGLSHISPGAGYVFARSSWEDDATYFFFKCGDRFTAHQHLDLNHFMIYRHEELAGDGGHYDAFGSAHDVNYHLRSIAHNTVLVFDPEERWRAGIRAGRVTGNDGGQSHPWAHHNGAALDVADWERQRADYDIGDLLAFEDRGDHLYVAGDATRAYRSSKLERFVRQIIYLRPSTFVVFDQVKAREPELKRTWLLQAMRPPSQQGEHWVIMHGRGRVFVQTLLPEDRVVRLISGDDLYRYGDHAYSPSRLTGAAPECRIEVSTMAKQNFFLHVLTATDAETSSVPAARVEVQGARVQVQLGETRINFRSDQVGGEIRINGRLEVLPEGIRPTVWSEP